MAMASLQNLLLPSSHLAVLALLLSTSVASAVHLLPQKPQAILRAGNWPAAAASCDGPVRVDFYGESLCPYCAGFINSTIAPFLDGPLADLIKFRYVAWGNAKNTSDQGIVCQHGAAECFGNVVINCLQYLHPNPQASFPFLKCFEEAAIVNKTLNQTDVEACAKVADLELHPLLECAKGPQGAELLEKAANETAALDPAHQYVPWVVVQGIALGGDYANLPSYVCASYRGDRPHACLEQLPPAGGMNTPAPGLHA